MKFSTVILVVLVGVLVYSLATKASAGQVQASESRALGFKSQAGSIDADFETGLELTDTFQNAIADKVIEKKAVSLRDWITKIFTKKK